MFPSSAKSTLSILPIISMSFPANAFDNPSVNVIVGKKVTLTATEIKNSTKKIRPHRKICFESDNKSIATVTKKGVIKGVKKGKTKVYVYAQNGVYKIINVNVK